jgi:hypothetical protein
MNIHPHDGGVIVTAEGADLVIESNDQVTATSRSRLTLTVDDAASGVIAAIDGMEWTPNGTSPFSRRLIEALRGGPARYGLRRLLDTALESSTNTGDEPQITALTRALFDDLPMATILHRAASPPDRNAEVPLPYSPPTDLCAGFAAGSRLETWTRVGGPRRLGIGPSPMPGTWERPWFMTIDWPDGHRFTPSTIPGVADRRRRMDIPMHTTPITFTTSFRDTVIEQRVRRGDETTVHEYVVTGSLTLDRSAIAQCAALPVVLPAPGCSSAAPSAAWTAGRRIADLRRDIDQEFRGTSTCTHLNDALRTLRWLSDLTTEPRSHGKDNR